MIRPPLGENSTLLLFRLRWLAWGGVVALLAADLATALSAPAQATLELQLQPAPFDRISGVGEACDCTHNHQTI